MFANSQMGGQSTGTAPDVCLTPAPPAPPVPVPYPNIALGNMGTPPVAKILFSGAPAHNLNTKIPASNGDNAGVNGGVASGRFMGESRFLQGSTKVMLCGKPATRLTDKGTQNNQNCPGIRVSPSQRKVTILS
jgi:hypothetical protein